jgi:hypothetical protein
MDKFKKEAIRGIQSHNLRERRSHSNPDIEYERSSGNYDLHMGASQDYASAVQNRIDDLLLVKAVRRDAVHLCGLIVSSDSAFFKDLPPEETKRFFEVSKDFLTKFVGEKNVISAMVHMDEKTPHMHFLHVPVTKDGRLNANAIYTRESLKTLQAELPQYLRDRGFVIQRGIEQEPGAKKKHLDTREFKQQQNALDSLKTDVRAVNAKLKKGQQQESELRERVQSYEQQAQEAEKELSEMPELPQASMFNYKSAQEAAQSIIERQKKALAEKGLVTAHNKKLQAELQNLREELDGLNKKTLRLATEKDAEVKRSNDAMLKWMREYEKAAAQMEEINKFFRWDHEANKKHLNYLQQERQEAARKAEEQKAREREQREREERERQAKEQAQEQERQKAHELERQREEERRLEHEAYRARRGMGMGR